MGLMLGPAHCAGGLLAGATVGAFVHPTPEVFAMSCIIGAGAGLIPDLDTRGTGSRSLGPLGLGINEALSTLSRLFFYATKSKYDKAPPHTDGGHRTMTHLILFMGAVAALFYFTAQVPYVLPIWLSVCGVWAVAGLFGSKTKKIGWIGTTILTLSIVTGAFVLTQYSEIGKDSIQTLTVALFAGLVSHYLYDITESGVPWPLAPLIPIRGQRWFRIKNPLLSASSTLANSVIFSLSIIGAGVMVLEYVGVRIF